MEKFEKFKNMPIIYPVVVLLSICLVITAALAGTNIITKEKITKLNAENEQKAMERLLKADSYEKEKIKVNKETYEYFIAVKDKKTAGYLMKVSEKGYGGTDTVMVALLTDGSVKSVEVLDVSNETPGLGQNAAKKEFTKQFKGKSETLTAKKYGTASSNTEIDAVASATITSKAITKAVNTAITVTANIIEGGSK